MPQGLLRNDEAEITDEQTETDGGGVETERTLEDIIQTYARE
jgi:hypothetical protein